MHRHLPHNMLPTWTLLPVLIISHKRDRLCSFEKIGVPSSILTLLLQIICAHVLFYYIHKASRHDEQVLIMSHPLQKQRLVIFLKEVASYDMLDAIMGGMQTHFQ